MSYQFIRFSPCGYGELCLLSTGCDELGKPYLEFEGRRYSVHGVLGSKASQGDTYAMTIKNAVMDLVYHGRTAASVVVQGQVRSMWLRGETSRAHSSTLSLMLLQSGSGKTHTGFGDDGITARAIRDFFEQLPEGFTIDVTSVKSHAHTLPHHHG
jgi:hypothetical protein